MASLGIRTQNGPKIRLHVPETLGEGMTVTLKPDQAHYVKNVMRCKKGEALGLFNGENGEWLAEITKLERSAIELECSALLRKPEAQPDSEDFPLILLCYFA